MVQKSGPKLLTLVRRAIRLRHYSRHTEEAYVAWVRRFVRFAGLRHPSELGEAEVERFLSSLAEMGVSATKQNQAASALRFLYEEVLGRPFARTFPRRFSGRHVGCDGSCRHCHRPPNRAGTAHPPPPNHRLKLTGGDRSKGSGVLCAGAHELSFHNTARGGRVARSLSAIR